MNAPMLEAKEPTRMRDITRLGVALLLSAALLPALARIAVAETKEDAPRIRVAKEVETDEKMEAKHGKKRAEKMARRTVKAVEFLGPDGKVRKRVDLGSRGAKLPEGVSEVIETKVAKSGRRVAIERRRHDSKERNPYKLRQGENVEVEWYDEDGKKLGTRTFKGSASVRAMADEGSVTVLVDEGLDEESFEGYHDVPGLKTTETLKKDPELLDHFVYVVRPSGEAVIVRRIKGPMMPPRNIHVSPNGAWFVYSLEDGVVYLNNVASGEEKRVETGMQLDWAISNEGELSGWKLEQDQARREKVDDRWVWLGGKRVFRKYVLRPGEDKVTKTGESKEQ